MPTCEISLYFLLTIVLCVNINREWLAIQFPDRGNTVGIHRFSGLNPLKFLRMYFRFQINSMRFNKKKTILVMINTTSVDCLSRILSYSTFLVWISNVNVQFSFWSISELNFWLIVSHIALAWCLISVRFIVIFPLENQSFNRTWQQPQNCMICLIE